MHQCEKKPVLSYELFFKDGGEGGIRTPDTLPYTHFPSNDSNLLIVFYVQIMPDDFVMQLHRF
ncbi:hypothetical protein B6V64_10445 [Escherichia coli]|nr:hypothetical protein [Escherichia coli]MBW1539872.1 hypothetical protein [Escherichia coli]